MQITIYELLLIMLVTALLVSLGVYIAVVLAWRDNGVDAETPLYNVPVAPVQEDSKKKKETEEDNDNSFYQ